MRVRAITPIDVPADELARRQRRYDRLSPLGLAVHLDNIGDGAPTALETAADVRASDRRVGQLAGATDPSSFDVVVPDCVLDPGVDAPASVPIVGLLRLAAGHLAAYDRPYGSVTRNGAIGDELARRLADYRLDTRYVGNEELHLDVDAIADDSRWHEALAAACNRLADRGAVVVINGCSAVDLGDASVGPVVVDPTRLALALLAAGTAAGALGDRADRTTADA